MPKIRDIEFNTHKNEAINLIKRFGGRGHVISALKSMGIGISYADLRRWVNTSLVPAHISHALNTMFAVEVSEVCKGFIEFYHKGHPLGKFYLHKDVTAVIRKKRVK